MAVMTKARSPRILLVRQWDQQVGGSGCCGRLSSAAAEAVCASGADDPYAAARADMESMGEVYRALHRRLGEAVDLTVVDPRNTAWLLPAVWRDARRRGLSRRATLRQVHRATSQWAVVCDGLVLLTRPAAVEDVVGEVLADLRDRHPDLAVRLQA